jgi:hypothetical protein
MGTYPACFCFSCLRQAGVFVFVFLERYCREFPERRLYPSTLSEKENGFPLWGTRFLSRGSADFRQTARLLTCTSIIARFLILVQTLLPLPDMIIRREGGHHAVARGDIVLLVRHVSGVTGRKDTGCEKLQQSDHLR